jgi:hypothetical protein
MARSIQEYWADVKEERNNLRNACNESRFQPKDASGKCDGTVFVRSLRNRDQGTIAGDIVLTTIQLGGELLAKGTHELCPDDAILEFKALHAKRKSEIIQKEQASKTNYIVDNTRAAAEAMAQQARDAADADATLTRLRQEQAEAIERERIAKDAAKKAYDDAQKQQAQQHKK